MHCNLVNLVRKHCLETATTLGRKTRRMLHTIMERLNTPITQQERYGSICWVRSATTGSKSRLGYKCKQSTKHNLCARSERANSKSKLGHIALSPYYKQLQQQQLQQQTHSAYLLVPAQHTNALLLMCVCSKHTARTQHSTACTA
jgi:hypothetical protein